MSARIKITSPCTKDINRSDSPGYFTLSSNSDSDIGDGSGDISGEDEDFLQPKQHDTTLSQSRNDDNFADSSSSTIVYNFQTPSYVGETEYGNGHFSSSNREETSPYSIARNTSQQHINSKNAYSSLNTNAQHDNDDTPPSPPPRPPPPFSYTSTLPPPVPKKTNQYGYASRSHSLHHQQRSYGFNGHSLPRQPSAPPISRNQDPLMQLQKMKPLQRVQPLQIQSPSLINVLKQGSTNNRPKRIPSNSECSSEGTYHSSSEDNPFSSLDSQNDPDEDKEHVNYIDDDSNYITTESKSIGLRSSISSDHISPSRGLYHFDSLSQNRATYGNKLTIKGEPFPEHSFEQENNRPLKNVTSQDKKLPVNNVINEGCSQNIKKEPVYPKTDKLCPSSRSSDLNNTIQSSSGCTEKIESGSWRSYITPDNQNQSNFGPTSPLQNAKRCVMNKVSSFTKTKGKTPKTKAKYCSSNDLKTHENTRQSIAEIDPHVNTDDVTPMRSSQQKKQHRQSLHNSIYNLIKCYEPDFTRNKSTTSINTNNEKNIVAECNHSERSSSSDDTATLTSAISSTLSARLSQLSIDSLERINSWLANPIESINSSNRNSTDYIDVHPHNLSIIEIDILDQCVNDLIKFTQGTLEDGTPRVKSTTRYSIVELVQNGVNSSKNEAEEDEETTPTVQQLVDKIEHEIYEQSVENDELHTSIIMTTTNEQKEMDDGTIDENEREKYLFSTNLSRHKIQGLAQKEPESVSNGNNPSHIIPAKQNNNKEDSSSGVIYVDKKRVSEKQTDCLSSSFIRNKNDAQNVKERNYDYNESVSSLGLIGEDKNSFQGEKQCSAFSKLDKEIKRANSCQALPNIKSKCKGPAPKPNVQSQSLGKQPIPSPRIKRKARKEKMLQEHKEQGKQALSKLKDKHIPNIEPSSSVLESEHFTKGATASKHPNNGNIFSEVTTSLSYPSASSTGTTESLALTRHSNSTITDDDTLKSEIAEITINSTEENDNGLDVLEDLCTQSRLIQRALTKTPSTSLLYSTLSNNNNNEHITDLSEASNSIQNRQNYEQQRTKVRYNFLLNG